MANFNITVLRPSGYIYSSAFQEIVRYLQHYLGLLGHNVIATENFLDPTNTNIVFGAHLCRGLFPQLPARTIIFNTEPLPLAPSLWGVDAVAEYSSLLQRFPVWDYSSFNTSVRQISVHCVIPLLYCPVFNRRAYRVDKADHLVFYGEITGWRRRLLTALVTNGINIVVVANDFGAGRDKAILSSRAVLNLHKQRGSSVLETVRCFYPLCMSIPVISELFTPDPILQPYEEAIFTFQSDKFVQRVVSLMRAPRLFERRSIKMLERFRSASPVQAISCAIDSSHKQLSQSSWRGRA